MPAELFISRSKLEASYRAVEARLPACRVLYGMKANGEPELLRILHELGSGFDVASGEEFARLMALGVSPTQVFCSLPLKPRHMLAQLASGGCSHFTFDTLGELARIRAVAPAARVILRVFIQDLDKDSFPFGMRLETLQAAIEDQSLDAASIDGVAFHVSRNYRLPALTRVLGRMGQLITSLPPGRDPLLVNLGGGYRHELPHHLAQRFHLDELYAVLNRWIEETARLRPCSFVCEPGRGIVEDACHIDCDVVGVKPQEQLLEAYLDLNIGRPPGGHPSSIEVVHSNGETEAIYDLAWHMAPTPEVRRWETRFVDTVCDYVPLYTLPLRRPLVDGERLRLRGMGAYTVSVTNYLHARVRPTTCVIP